MEKFYLAAICSVVPGLGRSRLPRLIQALGSAEAVYTASEQELKDAGICSEKQIINFINNRTADYPHKLAVLCSQLGVKLISIYDKSYPESLREISDPPLVLYIKGQLPAANYNIAVVGSREASEYGLKAARYFAQSFAKENITVVSGGARGIDTAAHEACLKAGGKTIAVLGTGIDVAYPAENKDLFARIAEHGVVVSEYPPGTQPLARNFPARNRIIVGLARGVLVAEAARKSGAIITANIAADEAREVYCVPGNIFLDKSIGCHDLIRTGAKLVDSPNDIYEDIRDWYQRNSMQQNIFEYREDREEKTENTDNKEALPDLSANAQCLYNLLSQGPLSLEELTEQSQLQFAEISMELLNMQMLGIIATDQLQRYYRV